MTSHTVAVDPSLDLVLERVVDVPPRLVWLAWTEPKHLMQWFTPAPWKTVECEIDLRPGGMFRTVMQSPEGERFPDVGCYLEVVDQRKLAFTSALGPGYRPKTPVTPPGEALAFSCVLTFEPEGTGTRYTAIAIHGDPGAKQRHEAMGFHDGWGKALTQLVDYVKHLDA